MNSPFELSDVSILLQYQLQYQTLSVSTKRQLIQYVRKTENKKFWKELICPLPLHYLTILYE
jgi:hypothetical protein